jgi:Holliday junction resolvase RusA-like endonuclease
MDNKITLTIPGEPQGKQRPRWSKWGMRTPQKTVNYETYIKELFANKYPEFMPLESELTMELGIWLSIPKSTSKKKQKMMEDKIIRPAKKPDIDNIIKSVLDALEGLAFKNDNQVVTLLAWKFYSHKPQLVIRIKETQS